MGYTTRVRGEFTIEPPLTWNEFKDSPFSPFPPAGDDRIELVLRVDEEAVETDEGPLMRRTASALVMSEIDEYRAHGLLEVVQRAVDSFPGHAFTGRLECEGQENTDIWRVIVRDGRALRIQPRIVWPHEEQPAQEAVEALPVWLGTPVTCPHCKSEQTHCTTCGTDMYARPTGGGQ